MLQIKQNLQNKLKVKIVLSLAFLAFFNSSLIAGAKQGDITSGTVIELVNESREEAGISPLLENLKLKAAAENKARDMAKNNYFAHFSPSGKSPWDFILEQKYDYLLAGENLAIDYSNAKEQHEAWMESPLHRQNILNGDYKEIGVGITKGFIDGRETTVTVQEFGVREENDAVVSAEKTLPAKKVVAGLSVKAEEGNKPDKGLSLDALTSEVSKQMKAGRIFEENKLTLAGWMLFAGLAILMTISDLTIVLYKKYSHLS